MGGGIVSLDGSPIIDNCLVCGNSAANYGGGITIFDGNPTISNCTFSANTAATSGGGLACRGTASPLITDCIVWGNSPAKFHVEEGTPVLQYTDMEGIDTREGNINADPLFVDPDGPDNDPETWEDNDFHLSAGSPCIDLGDPTRCPVGLADVDAEPRVMGTRLDMGADEFTGAPFDMLGDLNCDCTLDGFDIDAFVLALQWGSQYDQDYSQCDRALADINDDGYIDGFDIDPFVALLLGG